MAAITTKATFSLDLETANRLERLARIWNTSKSDVIRRLAREADDTAHQSAPPSMERLEPVSDDAARRLAALRTLQSSIASRGADFDAWKRAIADARR